METTLGANLLKAVIFDRDFRSQDEIDEISGQLSKFCKFAKIHSRKEIENFVLIPSAIRRAVTRQAAKRTIPDPLTDESLAMILDEITAAMKNRVQAQFVKLYCDFKRKKTPGIDTATFSEAAMNQFDQLWSSLDSRLAIAPGKETLSTLNARLQRDHGVNVSAMQIIECISKAEMPREMGELLSALDDFRKCDPPAD